MTNIVHEIRDIASRMPHQDQATLQNAASMLTFFFGQLQEHSPKMGGTHSYRLMNHWPATHCKGRTAEEAVTAAVRAMQCEAGPRLRGMNDGLLIGGGMRQTDAEYRAEIARLSLTDEEREAIRNVLHHIATKADYLQREDYHLRSLLERLG